MITIVTYDITSPKKLIKTNTFLKDYGINTQKSVFECKLRKHELDDIRYYCQEMLDLSKDSVRIYRICDHCYKQMFFSGQGIKLTEMEYMVF